MYNKNLTEDLRLRLSETDMEFLRQLSVQRGTSVSACIRSIIGEYRRSLDTLDLLKKAITIANENKGAELFNGNTKTDIDN